MPGKVNPVIPEAVMMVAAQVVGNDATITWANALGSSFELNVMMPIIAFNLLQSIDLLGAAANHLAAKCIDASNFLDNQKTDGVVRIEADEERCRQLIEKAWQCVPHWRPELVYDIAAAIAKTAYHENRTVREIASELVGFDPDAWQPGWANPTRGRAPRKRGASPRSKKWNGCLTRTQTIRGTSLQGGTSGMIEENQTSTWKPTTSKSSSSPRLRPSRWL